MVDRLSLVLSVIRCVYPNELYVHPIMSVNAL